MIFKARDFEFDLSKRSYIVGIVNITPDSFSDGGKYFDCDKAIQHAEMLIAEGADILDLGAESSRPQSESVDLEEEKKRLLPVVEALAHKNAVPISIDTTKAEVARDALELGASIINDISGFKHDSLMPAVVKEFNAGCVLMHMRGTPQTMQQYTDYKDIIRDIIYELEESVVLACNHGISRNSILLDPGIGFSKTAEQNNELLGRLSEFDCMGLPVLIGPSRKSFIGNILEEKDPAKRVFGTAAVVALAIDAGVKFVRVHDVAAMREVALVADAIVANKNS
ncbi:dihydropteroate synthase [Candidatus Omnitrophota bacterium]